MRSFTFNRPIILLFLLPMMVLVTMFCWGLTVEFRLSLLIMLLVTASLTGLLFYYSLLRRLKLGEGKAVWTTPMLRREIQLQEIRHYGVVKFRRFKFAYLSRATEVPFQNPEAPVVSDEDTFIIQYRPGAWQYMQGLIKALHPSLEPESFVRQ
ncbi:MAG: hypothetical protein IPP17_17070 [Bacteroidetes bacterium]|nr:hypothetical protein [Bacteroidota bacterium]